MANNDLGNQLSQLTEMKNILSELPAMFEKLGNSIGGQSDPLRELAGSLEEATNTDGIKDMDAALQELAGGLDEAGGAFSKFGKYAGAAISVVAGAKAGFSAFTQTLSGTFSLIGSLTTSVFNLGKSIVGGLMGSWEALVGLSYDLRDAGDSVAKEFEKLKNDFGSLANNEGKAVVSAFKELRSEAGFAAQTGMSLRFVFGGEFTAALAEISGIAKEMGNSFGQLKDQFVQNATALLVMNKGLDLTGEALAGLALTARAAGETMTEALTETMQQITYLEKQFGIDGRLIGKNLDAIAKDVTKFGHMTREELTATAAYATKLGISIESLGGVFDKFENFEEAATGAAKMAEAFGMNVDAMAMMNAESPAEQIDMMRQAFLETGKSLDELSRSEKAYLEELTGLKGDELYKAFDPANADIGFDDMLDAAEEAAEQVSPEEAMMNAAEKIEKAFDRMTEKSKGFFDAFTKGFMKGSTHAAMMNNPLKQLQHALDRVYLIGYNLAQALFSGKKGVFGEKSKEFLASFNAVLKRVVGFFQKLSDEIKLLAKTGDFGQFVTNMTGEIRSFFESDEVQNFGGKLLDKINDGLEYVLSNLPNFIDSITNILFGPDNISTIDILPEGKIKEALKRMSDIIKDNWEKEDGTGIKKSLENLFTKAFEALKVWAGKNPKLIGGVLAALFGPAVIMGALAGIFKGLGVLITTTLLPGLFKAISGWITSGGVGALGTSITSAFSTAFSTISTTVLPALSTAFNSILGILPKLSTGLKILGKVFGAIQLGISFVKTLFRLFEDITSIMAGPGDAFQKTGLIIEAVIGRILFFAMDFAAGFTDLFDKIVGGILGMFGIEVPSLTEFIFGEGGPEGLYKSFVEIEWASIPKDIYNVLIKPVLEFFSDLVGSIGKKAGEIFDYFNNIDFGAIVDNVVQTFKDLPGKIGGFFSDAASGALSAVTSLWRVESPSKAFADIATNVVKGIDGSLDFSSSFSSASTKAMNIAQNLLNPAALVDTVGEMIPGVVGIIGNAKDLVEEGVSSVAAGISSVTGTLAALAPIAADALVTKVANGLSGDGSVAVQHEGLNIQVHFKVNIDSKDLAAALGDDAEGGPFFVINTDRSGGGTEAAESAGE